MRIARIVYYLLIVVIMVIALVRIYGGPLTEGSGSYIGLTLSIGLLAVCALLWLASAGLGIALAPKQSVRVLASVGIMLLILGLSWALGTSEIVDSYRKVGFESESGSKWVSAGLNMMYAVGGLCILFIIISEVRSALQKR